MSKKLHLKFFLILYITLLVVSCSSTSYRTINEAIDGYEGLNDHINILSTSGVDNGEIVFFERQTFHDIGVAFLRKSNNKYFVEQISGYLGQQPDHSDWHYSRGIIKGEPYHIYYGKLLENPEGSQIFLKLNTLDITKEAQTAKASKSILWYVIFEEQISDLDINLLIE